MISHLLEGAVVISVGYAIVKHFGKAKLEADVKAAVAKVEAGISSFSVSSAVASIKADLKNLFPKL